MSEYQDYGFPDHEASHVQDYLVSPLFAMLRQPENRVILDSGCGNGWLADLLLRAGYDVYGIDASESGVQLANRKHPGRFAVMDFSGNRLPALLEQKRFDTIVSTEVIEHLYQPRRFIDFCREQLPPGGTLILSTPYHGYLKNLLIAITGSWDKHMNPLWDGGHIKLWTRRTLTALLEERGFRITGFRGCGRVPYLWKSMLIKAVRTDD